MDNAKGFAFGVQWHPEYDWEQDLDSRAIFATFGRATVAWAAARKAGGSFSLAAE